MEGADLYRPARTWWDRRMTAARLAVVILAVTDVPRSRDLYRAALGWEVTVDEPVYTELTGDGVRSGLYQRDGFAANTVSPVPPPAGAAEAGPAEVYVTATEPGARATAFLAGGGNSG